MPFTPIHFGAGLLFKAAAPVRFSLAVFIFTQVLIDLESLYFLMGHRWPVHRFLHTYPGATVAAVIATGLGPLACILCFRLWNRYNRNNPAVWVPLHIPWRAAAVGAFVGAYSHVLLDAIMHADMAPWTPLFGGNGLLGVITVGQLHLGCIMAGVIGAFVLGWRRFGPGAAAREES